MRKIYQTIYLIILFMCATPSMSKEANPPQGNTNYITTISIMRPSESFTENVDKLSGGGSLHSDWNTWIAQENIPSDLKAKTFDSVSYLALDIDVAGRVAKCRVLKASMDSRFDNLACNDITQKGLFPVLFSAPGILVPNRINFNVRIRTESISVYNDRMRVRPVMMVRPSAPPKTWPWLRWSGGVAIAAFPDLQNTYPENAEKPKEGVTSLDIEIARDVGVTECRIGISSGNPKLDDAACSVSRNLKFNYTTPCEDCGIRSLPLEFVWLKHGSFIRVPVFNGTSYNQSERLLRDPAEKQVPTAYVRKRLPYNINVNEFPVTPEQIGKVGLEFGLLVDENGNILECHIEKNPLVNDDLGKKMCSPIFKYIKYNKATDIFGNPVRTVEFLSLYKYGSTYSSN